MGKVIVLTGDPGVGKTTLAWEIQRCAEKSERWTGIRYIHHGRGDSTAQKLADDMQMVEDARDDRLFIFDRWYLDELAYAPIEARASTIKYEPEYWERVCGKWIDGRGVRAYLAKGLSRNIEADMRPATQVFRMLVRNTGWWTLYPRDWWRHPSDLAMYLLGAV